MDTSLHKVALIEFLHVHKASFEEVKVYDRIDDDSSWRLQNGQLQANGRNAYPTSQLENSFTQLLSIDFSNSDSDSSHEFVLWLILNAPNLKAASLRTSHLQLNIVVAMNKSRHLSKLEIMRYRWGDNNNYLEGLIELLNHHMTMGNKSTHKELTIRTTTLATEAPWLFMIFKLQCLKKLELLTTAIPESCLHVMEKIGLGCPALEEITLGDHGCDIGDHIIASLCKYLNLKCLRIRSKPLNPDSLMPITLLSNLQSLYLECDVPESVIDMLRKHISKVVINKTY